MSRHKSLTNQFRSIWDHLEIKPIHSYSLLRVSAQLTFRHGWANLIAASSLLQPPSASSHQGYEAVDCTGMSWEFWITHCSLSGSWKMACWRAPTSFQSEKSFCPDCHSKLARPLAQEFCRITYGKEFCLRAHQIKWSMVESISASTMMKSYMFFSQWTYLQQHLHFCRLSTCPHGEAK